MPESNHRFITRKILCLVLRTIPVLLMLMELGIASGAANPFVFPNVIPDPNPVIVHGTGGELFTFLKTAATTNGSYSLGDAVFTTGPLPHIHHREDEWFYVVSGQVAIEMGDDVYPDITQVPGINLPKETMHIIIRGSRHSCLGTTLPSACLPKRRRQPSRNVRCHGTGWA